MKLDQQTNPYDDLDFFSADEPGIASTEEQIPVTNLELMETHQTEEEKAFLHTEENTAVKTEAKVQPKPETENFWEAAKKFYLKYGPSLHLTEAIIFATAVYGTNYVAAEIARFDTRLQLHHALEQKNSDLEHTLFARVPSKPFSLWDFFNPTDDTPSGVKYTRRANDKCYARVAEDPKVKANTHPDLRKQAKKVCNLITEDGTTSPFIKRSEEELKRNSDCNAFAQALSVPFTDGILFDPYELDGKIVCEQTRNEELKLYVKP